MPRCLQDFYSVHLLAISLCILRPVCMGLLSALSTARSEGETGIAWLCSVSSTSTGSGGESSKKLLTPSSWGIPGTFSTCFPQHCILLPVEELWIDYCRFSLSGLFVLLLVDKPFAIINKDEVSSLLFFLLYILKGRKEVVIVF